MESRTSTFRSGQAQSAQPSNQPRTLPILPPPPPLPYQNRNNFGVPQFNNGGIPFGLPPFPNFPTQQPEFIQPIHYIPTQGPPQQHCRCGRCIRHDHALPGHYPGEIPLYQDNRHPHGFEPCVHELENIVDSQAAILDELHHRLEFTAHENRHLKRMVNFYKDEVRKLHQRITRKNQLFHDLIGEMEKEKTSSFALKGKILELEKKLELKQKKANSTVKCDHSQLDGEQDQDRQNKEATDEALVARSESQRNVIKRRRKEDKSSEGLPTKCAMCGASFPVEKDFYDHLSEVHFNQRNEAEKDVVPGVDVKVEVVMEEPENAMDDDGGASSLLALAVNEPQELVEHDYSRRIVFCERCDTSFPDQKKFAKHLQKCLKNWFDWRYQQQTDTESSGANERASGGAEALAMEDADTENVDEGDSWGA